MAAAAASADWDEGDAGALAAVLVVRGAECAAESAAAAGEGQPARRGRSAAGLAWLAGCCWLVNDEMGGSEMPPWADDGREVAWWWWSAVAAASCDAAGCGEGGSADAAGDKMLWMRIISPLAAVVVVDERREG